MFLTDCERDGGESVVGGETSEMIEAFQYESEQRVARLEVKSLGRVWLKGPSQNEKRRRPKRRCAGVGRQV